MFIFEEFSRFGGTEGEKVKRVRYIMRISLKNILTTDKIIAIMQQF
jgi:hypothetical protein